VGVLREITRLPPSGLERLEKLEQLRALEHGVRIVVGHCVERPPSGVDTMADLERARHRAALMA
jgi:3-deoxy-manno-octulosonate cytidylyltransferase (CMP-KDO synthetase)